MLTEFAQDLVDPDGPLEEAFAERPGKPLKIRVQPMILRTVAGKGGQYQTWKQVRWTLECDTPVEARSIRDTLRVFFEVIGRAGPEAVTAALSKLGKEAAA